MSRSGIENLKAVFANAAKDKRLVFISYVPEAFPLMNCTADLLLGLQQSGVDVVEVGLPFTDPIADGPSIQRASKQALANGASVKTGFQSIATARQKGLICGVIVMTYWNVILAYGVDQACHDAAVSGVDGMLIVDLPVVDATEVPLPDYALKEDWKEGKGKNPTLQDLCRKFKLAIIPMVSAHTTPDRVGPILRLGGSGFIYCVSVVKTTGAVTDTTEWAAQAAKTTSHAHLLLSMTGVTVPPVAVGFGISKACQVVALTKQPKAVQGFVVGSALVDALGACYPNGGFCSVDSETTNCEVVMRKLMKDAVKPLVVALREASFFTSSHDVHIADSPAISVEYHASCASSRDWYLGGFGGRFIAEPLLRIHEELSDAFSQAINDQSFNKQLDWYRRHYVGGPTPIQFAENLTRHVAGPSIFFKREDLAHTGAHKINNALGQALLAKRLGKSRVIAETGAGQHGVATATACAFLGLKCTIYMGRKDMKRQNLNVVRMKILGANVVPVDSGTKTLKDAVNEAMRAWMTESNTTYFLVGSAVGPDPYPKIVKYFQSVLSREARSQMLREPPFEEGPGTGKLPDIVVACVGGGSNAIGTFAEFVDDESVQLIGVEAGGVRGVDLIECYDKDVTHESSHCASLTAGTPGVFQGAQTFLIQTREGHIKETSSISAGLDYPAVSPQLAHLKQTGRASFDSVTDAAALDAVLLTAVTEGIIPALESAHAIAYVTTQLKHLPKEKVVLVMISGRGDKDMATLAKELNMCNE